MSDLSVPPLLHRSAPASAGRWHRLLAAGALAAASLVAGAQPAAPGPGERPAPVAADFVRSPAVSGVVISPAGTHIAMIVDTPQGRRVAAVRSLDSEETRVIAAFSDANVVRVRWVNDRRLVFDAARPEVEISEGGAATHAVDLDGRNPRELIAWRQTNAVAGSRIERSFLPYGWFVQGTLDDGSDDILIFRLAQDSAGDAAPAALARLNTRTGRVTTLSFDAPPFAYTWVLDARRELRVVGTARNGRQQLHWRPPGSDTWRLVRDESQLDAGTLTPLFLENDGTLIVEGRPEGRDTSALFALDLESGRVESEPLLAVQGFDLGASVAVDSRTREVIGVRTVADRPVTVWFHERMAQIQAAVDAALPGRVNWVVCGRCLSSPHYVVYSHSDAHPGEYLHYDHGARRIRRLAPARPWLAEEGQGRRSFHRITARDGMSLPLVVTHPPGIAPTAQPAQALPTVVLVHGGPWVRGGDTSWQPWAQFLATRGYRVLEVEFRGGTGFGWQHFSSGWKAWGTAMQDDLADAVAWAAAQGLTDPGRVCLMGGSYGGYAALMSMVRHPQTYRCAVSFNGVTDPGLLFTSRWSDTSAQARRFSMPTLVGDPRTEAELLREASPLARAAEIRGPVLMAWGSLDRRVPPEHATRFVRAARGAGVAVETQIYEEGHSFTKPEHHADFLQRTEQFLRTHIARPGS
jgi:dipeptidyl aminopeptidase/acylaminoacyl peptidase